MLICALHFLFLLPMYVCDDVIDDTAEMQPSYAQNLGTDQIGELRRPSFCPTLFPPSGLLIFSSHNSYTLVSSLLILQSTDSTDR
jgi:hypothetical protein